MNDEDDDGYDDVKDNDDNVEDSYDLLSSNYFDFIFNPCTSSNCFFIP